MCRSLWYGGRISDLPSRQSCGHFCGSNGILWSVPVPMEFQKQSGMVHITHINRPPWSWFRRWLGQECQLQYFELFSLAAQVRERPSVPGVFISPAVGPPVPPSNLLVCVCVFFRWPVPSADVACSSVPVHSPGWGVVLSHLRHELFPDHRQSRLTCQLHEQSSSR